MIYPELHGDSGRSYTRIAVYHSVETWLVFSINKNGRIRVSAFQNKNHGLFLQTSK